MIASEITEPRHDLKPKIEPLKTKVMAQEITALTPAEEVTLRSQGLKEDIRNQLYNAKNILFDIENWEKEEDPDIKEIYFKRLKRNATQTIKNVDHICLSLDYYDCVEIKQKTST